MNDDEILKKRFTELAQRAWERGIYERTGFLSPAGQDVFLSARKDFSHVAARLYSPLAAGIRKIAVFGSAEETGYEWDDPICVIHITPRSEKFAEELSHRDYLGSVLALGIDRELTGDIVIRGKEAWLFALEQIVPFICENLVRVRHTNVSCSMVNGDIPELEPRFETMHANIQSGRADLIVAAVTDGSRETAKKLIAAEKVFINGRLLTSSSHRLKSGDEIVVRGSGKYIYDGIVSTTRKDRLNISLRKYI